MKPNITLFDKRLVLFDPDKYCMDIYLIITMYSFSKNTYTNFSGGITVLAKFPKPVVIPYTTTL